MCSKCVQQIFIKIKVIKRYSIKFFIRTLISQFEYFLKFQASPLALASFNCATTEAKISSEFGII